MSAKTPRRRGWPRRTGQPAAPHPTTPTGPTAPAGPARPAIIVPDAAQPAITAAGAAQPATAAPEAAQPATAAAGAAQPATAAPEAARPASAAAAEERAALVRACIYVRDRVTSAALAQRLDQALAEVGVELVDPVGERFDATRHEAAGVQHTRETGLVGTVAAVEVSGYADRGLLLRAPVVTVYQAAPVPPAGGDQHPRQAP
jgi:GrpE